MRLTTIGTGTAAPNPGRVSAGHLVEAAEVRLLLDCGSGVVHRMASLNVDWRAITHVALTHFDADHTSDLATLCIAWRYGQLPPRSAPVEIIGPQGLQTLVERVAELFWPRLLDDAGYQLTIRELAPGEGLDLPGGVRLDTRKVPHTAESIAYSITDGGRRIVYTGDTAFDAGLGEWARGCDVMLCECSLPAEMSVESHLTPEGCAALARIASPKHLALTHFYPPVERVDVRAIVAVEFGGPVTLAADGWNIEIEEP
ncbi:MAG: ribonuclease Z [Gemmatimonadota bacterium]|nr:ribonuclease Z [Gemmatimonadota bacterium]